MKIAILHFGRHGAGPVYSLEMAKALSAEGLDVVYYASSYVENRSAVEKTKFVSKFYKTYKSKIAYLLTIIFKRTISQIIKDINQEKPDVVYCPMNDLWTPFIFKKISSFMRVKTIHDVGVHEGNSSLFNRMWNESQFENSEKFIILSKGFLPILIKKGIERNRIQVIPHAGFDYYNEVGGTEITDNSIKNVENTLLFFGRIDKYKGLGVLLKAMETVIEHNPKIVLLIAGNGDMSEYREQINKLGPNVIVINEWIKDNDVAGIVRRASAIVLPYIHATQSGVIPLAYAFSKPVIATNVGCLDEQVLDGETGFLVRGGDSEALSEAIIKLYDSPEQMKTMGKKARCYMKECLTWEASAKALKAFLK